MSYRDPYYMPRMPMKTPEQYQAELLRQLQPNLEMYNKQYFAYQQQSNSGQYIKVSSYDETKQIQAPSDGRPIIIIDDTNGFLYSKKFENGQEFIKSFRLVPNEAQEEKKTDDVLEQILQRLDRLEGKNNGVSGNATEPIEDPKPSGV